MQKIVDKTGAPPGTLIYSGENRTEKVQITLIEYNEKEFIEKTFSDIQECMLHVNPTMVKWINVEGIHDVALVEEINQYPSPGLTLEEPLSSFVFPPE